MSLRPLLMLQQNKIHRIFLKNIIEINNAIKLDKDTSNHIKNVLRIRNNEKIKIFNGNGKEYNAKVEYQEKSITTTPYKLSRQISIDDHQIILAQCIPNYKAMDLTIQKSTELGVNQIIPISSSRSHPGNHEKKMDHWKKIIIHATEQSNGLYLPVIDKVMSLEDFINKHNVDQCHNICFNIMGRSMQPNDINHKSHAIMIGPEGGFSNQELELLRNNNWNIITLGDRIFRTETASIVAQSILRGY